MAQPGPYQAPPPRQPPSIQGNMHPIQPPRQYSPSPYQQSPGAMSPGGYPPAKRPPQMSPNPPSPYTHNSPYGPQSPYAASPPAQYLSQPHTPVATQAPPNPYHQPPTAHHAQPSQQAQQQHTSMPPPKVPYSRTADAADLEKLDPKGSDINAISDVLSGAGVDVRMEEEALMSFTRLRSQAQPTSVNNSFDSQYNHRGNLGPAMTEDDRKREENLKHATAMKAMTEATQNHMADPFLHTQLLRNRLAERTQAHGIGVNIDGLFDLAPEEARNNVRREMRTGPNGEPVIVKLQADSLLNRNAPLVDILTLISLAAQERLRTVLDDGMQLARARRATAHGVVPPDFADIAVASGKGESVTVVPTNITQTVWEDANQGASPKSGDDSNKEGAASQSQPNNRLPTPPADVPPTPKPTVSFEKQNEILKRLKRKCTDDRDFEKARVERRQKRARTASGQPSEPPAPPPPVIVEKLTKKERDRLAKTNQSEEVLHRKTNETASMALFGGKKKYSWMTGGSRPATPRGGTVGPAGGASPAAITGDPEVDAKLRSRQKPLGVWKEDGKDGKGIQLRDVVTALEADGRDRRALHTALARVGKFSVKDDKARR